MASPGSLGNMLAAGMSLFFPGMGQFFQGRLLTAVLHLGAAFLLWPVMLGWIVHLWSAMNAARYQA